MPPKEMGKLSALTVPWKLCCLKQFKKTIETGTMQQLPKVMFAYCTAIHKATGYTPFYVIFIIIGAPHCYLDIMSGIHRKKKQEVLIYVSDTHCSLQKAYTNVCQGLHDAHQSNKSIKV